MTILQTTPDERRILADIEEKTGLRFSLVGGIPIRDPEVAEQVLPVLAEWVKQLDDGFLRRDVYACFFTPHAYHHLDRLISWWQSEPFPMASECLTQILASLARPCDGKRLWALTKDLPPQAFFCLLWAKLAKFPEVEREVKDRLVAIMQGPNPEIGDLQHIAVVEDPRIRQWFEQQTNSKNRVLKTIAKRVVARGKRLPRAVTHSAVPPERSMEIFSAEVDLSELAQTLKSAEKELGLRFPPAVRGGRFLSAVPVDQWLVAFVNTPDPHVVRLWLRLEDVDCVEIVVTSDAAALHAQ